MMQAEKEQKQILNSLAAVPHEWRNGIVTVGNFDGVHRGHQEILRQIREAAFAHDCPAIVITFDPHPLSVLHPERQLRLINELDDRIGLIAAQHISRILIIQFDLTFASLTPELFLQQLTTRLAPTQLLVGHDFRFGQGRQGDFSCLKQLGARYNLDVLQVPAVSIDNEIVSSTLIRNCIEKGNVSKASNLLGRAHFIRGIVVNDRHIGRTIGYPTANVTLPEIVIPGDGVYASIISWEQQRAFAMTYLGRRPTFNDTAHVCESYLLDCSPDLYGKEIRIEFIAFIRPDQTFRSIEDLTRQIAHDELQSRAVFAKRL